jgi:3-hydroxyacyl-CoA dehydrogenase
LRPCRAGRGDRDLTIEAIVEREQDKVEVFSRLDKVVKTEDAILASNTSSIPSMKIAMATSLRDHVIGVHFFNPAPVLTLVELAPSPMTADTVELRARTFATEILDTTVIRSQDRAGFVVNSLTVPYILAAIRMLDSGFASAEDRSVVDSPGPRPALTLSRNSANRILIRSVRNSEDAIGRDQSDRPGLVVADGGW